jgi:hypothetical protein
MADILPYQYIAREATVLYRADVISVLRPDLPSAVRTKRGLHTPIRPNTIQLITDQENLRCQEDARSCPPSRKAGRRHDTKRKQ